MKYLAAALALASGAAVAAPPQSQRLPPVDLRRTLQQYHPGSTAAPRELTPQERAELRRQLSQYPLPLRRR